MNVVDWLPELEHSRYDSTVGIRIAKLAGDTEFSTYLTVITPDKGVTAHYHRDGDEHYHIIKGHGEITLTDMESGSTTITAVHAQNSFVIPRNTLHALKNTGANPLILLFSCPETHLSRDRFTL